MTKRHDIKLIDNGELYQISVYEFNIENYDWLLIANIILPNEISNDPVNELINQSLKIADSKGKGLYLESPDNEVFLEILLNQGFRVTKTTEYGSILARGNKVDQLIKTSMNLI